MTRLFNTLLTGAAIFIAAATASAQTAMPWGTGVTYLYDGSGNIRKIGNDPQVYDAFGRLVQSDVKGLRSNFTYDQYGNRTGCTTGGGDCQYGLTPSEYTNRLGGVTYDASGNATSFMNHTYTYDAVNMITRDGGVPIRDFVYTADDERLAEYTLYNGTWRWTVRDTSGKVLRELTSQGTAGTLSWQWSKDYVYRDGALMASRQRHVGTNTVTTYHYHLDHLGTPRRITDDADQIVGAHDYHAFGPETSGGTHESPLTLAKFTGHERDVVTGETSATLDYMHARYYSPALGRFLSVDPSGIDPKRPQSWNRYSYVLNSAVNRVDPDGRCSKPATKKGEIGICIEGFIAASRVNGPAMVEGVGDGRTFAANDPSKTNRVQVQIVVNPAKGTITARTTAGVTEAAIGRATIASGQGTGQTTLSNATRQKDGTITFTARTVGVNGLIKLPGAPQDTIDFKFNIAVTPDGRVGLMGGGRTDGYPSVGAYGYTNGGTTTLYENRERAITDLAVPMEIAIPAKPPQ